MSLNEIFSKIKHRQTKFYYRSGFSLGFGIGIGIQALEFWHQFELKCFLGGSKSIKVQQTRSLHMCKSSFMCALPQLTLGFRFGIKIGFILRIGIKIQGQSMQTGLFELATDFLIDGRCIGCLEGPRITAGGLELGTPTTPRG